MDGLLESVSQHAYRRASRLLATFDKQAGASRADLQAECLAECWLALKSGMEPVAVSKLAANSVRKATRIKRFGGQQVGQTFIETAPVLERQLDAEAYLAVVRKALTPQELYLLEARELQEMPFGELAKVVLTKRGEPVTPESQARESSRLRKQLNRLRVRCARLISEAYPDAAEEISCWN